MIKSGDIQVDTKFFFKRIKSECHGVKSQKKVAEITYFGDKSQKKSQKLHILETNRKNLHPQKNPVIRYALQECFRIYLHIQT